MTQKEANTTLNGGFQSRTSKIDSLDNKQSIMQVHFKYIDKLKGFAILSVIMGHFIIGGLNKMGIVYEMIGSYHMPLFLFLSGMVVNVTNIRKLVIKTARFMMPMITIGTVCMLVNDISFSSFLGNSFKGGYWYLYVLSVFYFLILMIGKINNEVVCIIISLSLYGCFYALNSFISKELNEFFCVWIMKQYWPFFIVGYFITKYKISQTIFSSDLVYAVAIVLYFISFSLWYNGMSFLNYLVSFSFILAALHFMFVRENRTSFVERQMEYIGARSLDVYIYHYFFYHITHLAVVGAWLEDSENIFIEALLSVVYSIVVAYLCIGLGKIIRSSNIIRIIVYGEFVEQFLNRKGCKC